MRALILLAAAATLTCSYDPPGSCTADAACGPGTTCQSSVCIACPSGLCPATETLPAAGDVMTILTTPFSSNTNIQVRFPQGAAPAGQKATLSALQCPITPPPPLGGGCVAAFKLDTPGLTRFARALTVRGVSVLRPGTELMIAELQNGAWVDTITAVTGATTFKSLHPTASLPGILEPGFYLVYSAGPGVLFPPADFGVALIPDDGNGKSGLQVVTYLDDDGLPLNPPTAATLNNLGSDLDGAALTPDGSQGVMVDGGNFVVFFTGVGSGQLVASTGRIDVTPYGGDGDAIAIMPEGDEAVISADGPVLVVISGIFAGNPALATTLPLPAAATEDGLVISNDGKVLLARGSGVMSVFAIAPITPTTGSLGGRLAHSYTHVTDFGATVSSPAGEDGRDGLAVSPANSSNGAVVGLMPVPPSLTNAAVIQLITGLPGTAAVPPVVHTAVPISGAQIAYAVTITPDGTRAIVGTDAGLVMFTGVDTGNLVETGAPFAPAPMTATSGVPTLGITPDGKYVVALSPAPSPQSGALLMMPINATDFGAPVSTLTGVAIPSNDQILLH
jgi:hypothetical protein